LGDRSAATFWQLWLSVRRWECFLYITDGYAVYRCFIADLDHIGGKVAKTLLANSEKTYALVVNLHYR
jgi:IS1 family transposase